MNIQDAIWAIALVGMGLVALGFIFVISQSGKPSDNATAEQSAQAARRLQGIWFRVLLVIFVVGTWATLRHFPIPAQSGTLDAQQVVDVVGGQWYWKIEPTTVQAGRTVEFRVTSADVNHGFALYSPEGHILTQTQAMPGYTNKLLYTFSEPGTYVVQCLEYCGVGHVPMKAEIQVAAGGESPAR